MAGIRPVGGQGARGKKVAMPSPQELLGRMGAPYGFGPRQTTGISKLMGGSFDPFAGIPVAASGGEGFETISLIRSKQSLDHYIPDVDRTTSQNLAGTPLSPGGNYGDYYYVDDQGNFVDTSIYRQSYDVDDDTGELIIPGESGPQQGESNAPAPITVVPTSTINPKRPRTVAAGYDKGRETLTVIFRDGTFYNYYEVSATEWNAFKANVSKGRYIYSVLDYHPRGPADVGSVPEYARRALYRMARAGQVVQKGQKQFTPEKGLHKPSRRK